MSEQPANPPPRLYLVATPIGNLEDITLRAVRLLRTARWLAAEDTRVARRLLAGLALPTPARLISLRARNEAAAAEKLCTALGDGEHAVYIADAGTPGINDPGGRLVLTARRHGIAVLPVPGASAVTALLSIAAPPAVGGVHFLGFPPVASAARRQFFTALRPVAGSVVLFEAPHRIARTVAELAEHLGGERRAVLGREMSKRHEQYCDDNLAELTLALADGRIPCRGEFTLLIETPAESPETFAAAALFTELCAHLPPRRAAALTAKLTGADSDALYRSHSAARSPKNWEKNGGKTS